MPCNMVSPKPRVNQHKFIQITLLISKICTLIFIPALILCLIYILFPNYPRCCRSPTPLPKFTRKFDSHSNIHTHTNTTHLVFGISGSSDTWKYKKPYIESWWRPNKTRGYLYLDRPPTEYLPWPSKLDPPYRIYEDMSKGKIKERLVKMVADIFRAEHTNVRWYVMADDDTVLFVDNLVEVLNKYDHREFYYVGANSECVVNNVQGSFEMGFVGAGFALSYPLVEALVKNLDVCIKRYSDYNYRGDQILQSCVADLGVPLTHEKGFHQIDLRGDIFGLLSSHPNAPLISLHHLDAVQPIFPHMSRHAAISHLISASSPPSFQSRLLQQTTCHHSPTNWTLSISYGYSIHIYETLIHPSTLVRPMETFTPWKKGAWPPYVFSTRRVPEEYCGELPHLLFFDEVEGARDDESVATLYGRRWEWMEMRNCSTWGGSTRSYPADHVKRVRVVSPGGELGGWVGSRRECCDVNLEMSDVNTTIVIKLRTCKKNEIVG